MWELLNLVHDHEPWSQLAYIKLMTVGVHRTAVASIHLHIHLAVTYEYLLKFGYFSVVRDLRQPSLKYVLKHSVCSKGEQCDIDHIPYQELIGLNRRGKPNTALDVKGGPLHLLYYT